MFERFSKLISVIFGVLALTILFFTTGLAGSEAFASELASFQSTGDVGAGGSVFLFTILVVIAGVFMTKKSKEKKKSGENKSEEKGDWREMMSSAGYDYDEKQDIFYSKQDAWQREMGYCRLYDEAAAPLNMIIDCEPIYFEYNKKRWLIELWKGQYGMTTGCEIGVYNTEGPDIDIPGTFKGTFYNAVKDDERLLMSMNLKKDNKTLFSRKEKHWWLTAFVLGEFSEPSELVMNADIALATKEMLDAFVKGLTIAGYSKDEFTINKGNRVYITFKKPHNPQPLSRIKATDYVIQMKNKALCDKYLDITSGYDTFPEKVNALQQKSPELYKAMLTLGKPLTLFKSYDVIKKNIK